MTRTRHRPRKRQRPESPDSVCGDQESSEKSNGDFRNKDELKLSEIFPKFEDVLCELLTVASVVQDTKKVLGEYKGNFVTALKRMVEAGDMPWVCELDSGVEESTGEMEVDECAEGASENQMDVDEEVPDNQIEIEEGEIVSSSRIQDYTKGASSVLVSGAKTIGQFVAVVIPVKSPRKKWPPPLPSVKNAALRQQALTPESTRNTTDPKAHYQRLEWLGDAYLEAMVSRILFERFPEIREGVLTRMRQPLLTNRLFSSYAAAYNFDTMITELQTHSGGKDWKQEGIPCWKVLADCFEAYVAAVALSDLDKGFEILMQWLVDLYEPVFNNVTSGGINVVYLNERGVAYTPATLKSGSKKGKRSARLGNFISKAENGILRRGRAAQRQAEAARKAAAERKLVAERKLAANFRNQLSLSTPDNRYSGKKLIQYESGPLIIIDDSEDEAEDEGDWEEIEIIGKGGQSSAGTPIDMAAKRKLSALLTGDGVSLEYVCASEESTSSGVDAMQGVEGGQNEVIVTVKLTGWGCVNRPIGNGWGANEEEAGLRAAMSIMSDKNFYKELALKGGKTKPVPSSAQVESLKHEAQSIPVTSESSAMPAPWEEINGVVIIQDDD